MNSSGSISLKNYKVLDEIFNEAVLWYEDQLNRMDTLFIPHPEDVDFEKCKEIFWEVEEEHEVEVDPVEMKQAILDAYNYLNEINNVERITDKNLEEEFFKCQLAY
jgi:hypothetical protein